MPASSSGCNPHADASSKHDKHLEMCNVHIYACTSTHIQTHIERDAYTSEDTLTDN